MRKMKIDKVRKNKGFSLIELIIAIAILVILTGFLAPNFMRHIEKSRESVCRKNMDELLNVSRMEFVGGEESKMAVVVDGVIADYKDREPCPSGGEYENWTKEMGGDIPWIMCKIHDAETLALGSILGATKNVYDSMVKFAEKDYASVLADLKLKYPGVTSFSNDTLRKYLFEQTYNGNWPKLDMSPELKAKYKISGDYYIQPCLNNKVVNNKGENAMGSDKDVIVFAKSQNTADNGWNTDLIYDPDKKVWCKLTGGISVNDKTWSEVRALMDQKQKEGKYTELTDVK